MTDSAPPPEPAPPPGLPPPQADTHEPSLWERLKHHKVAQWTLAYVAGAYTMLHGAEMLAEAQDWPHAVIRILSVLLVLATPIVATLAWYHGAQGARRVSTGELLIIGLLVGIGATLLWHYRGPEAHAPSAAQVASAPSPAVPAIPEQSVAVLPLLDMSEKKDQEYFADGMAEEILDLLAKIPGLRVPARTSSFYFKGKSDDIPTIARRLRVANILEGSVRKSGNHVRVTVQLVRADNGYHLWSETYDRTLDDLFKVQDDIAGKIVSALKISMDSNAAPRTAPTHSAEAHRLLLQAQFFLSRETADDSRRAATYYQQAIDIDPNFAEAWAGLSRALNTVGQRNEQTRQHFHELALHAAERAIALDPKLTEAHIALAAVRYWLEWDWASASTEYEQARSLDPDNSYALNGVGRIAAIHGRLTDALRLWEQASARDPLNLEPIAQSGLAYYAMGRLTEALTAVRKALELVPSTAGGHAVLAQILLAAGQKNVALAEVEKESDPGFRAYGLARAYIVLGRSGDADSALAEVEKSFAAEQPYNIATLHALRGEGDLAFSWLNRAYEQRDVTLIAIPPFTVDPDMSNLHSDPRWTGFLHKLNLP